MAEILAKWLNEEIKLSAVSARLRFETSELVFWSKSWPGSNICLICLENN